MTEKKGWGNTVLGWFVVTDAQPESSYSEDDLIASAAAEELPPEVEIFKTAPPSAPGGVIDYDGVFEAAGVDEEERSRVARARDLLGSLPEGTDATVKKQIVEASLKAFGVPIEKIIEAAVEEMQALEAYIRTGSGDTQTLINESDERIHSLEEEIRSIRQVMQDRVQEQQSVIKGCNEKKLEIQQVLEFFGQEAVARVVKESPKLYEPPSKPSS